MNKLGKRDYIKLISEILTETYGDTLKEYGTDVVMAEAVVKGLDEYLYFHTYDMDYNEFKKWKKKRREGGRR